MNTIIKTTSKTETNPPVKKIPFQHRLAESMQKHCHHVAIERGEFHLTYGVLESKANCIAHRLTNIPPESFIGICVDDKIDIIILMIGILKARCAFTILDTALPTPRLIDMIRLTHVPLIFTSAQNKEWLANDLEKNNTPTTEKPATLIVVDDLFYQSNASATPSQESSASPYDREDKIYIYFTSGTTGQPKAMVGMNKSLLHFIDWEIQTFGINNTFRFSQWITPGFDAFLRDVFTPLCAGAVICMPPRQEMILDSSELFPWLNARQISFIHCVPSMFRLLNTFTDINQAQENLKSLRYILLAGEKIIPHELTRWFDMFATRIQLVNCYGTSETTMAKTFYFIRPEDVNRSIIPVGQPIPGARIFILDKNRQACGKISAGEIYIRTPFRTHGYCNDPEATYEKFIPNPFTHDPNDWFYKTGDLGRLLEDGNLEVLGRMDRQVKVRGVRVEPEEIENVILKHPGVAEAVIIDKENKTNETYLCAYYVPEKVYEQAGATPSITPAALAQYLNTHLPAYMVPTYITPLEKMPLTANGKIDRNALPEPRLEQDNEYTPPANEMEEKLAAIWSEVLGLESHKISVTANFFQLGGHSLNATVLVSKIHRQLGIKVPLAEIFKNPYINRLAHFIVTHMVTEKTYISIEPVEMREYYPLSSAQKRLFFLQQFDPGSTSYNMPMVIPLGKGIDTRQLEATLNQLITRHENFRTSFIDVQDHTFQRLHPQVSFKIDVFDFSAADFPDTQHLPKIEAVIRDFVRPFDLSQAPLLRCGFIRTPAENDIWLLDMHHIISDGTSQTILTEDFFALSQGRELPPLPLQYKDFSQWQNRLFADDGIKTQEAYWLSQLAGEIPRLDLPVDYKRPPVFTFAGSRISFMLEPEDALNFRALGNTYGVTLYMNILAALNVLFFKYTGQTDIIIGGPIAGRHHADLQHIVGMFVNTLVLRHFPRGEITYVDFLTQVRESCINAFENQDVQFEQLVEKLDLERDPSRNPLFDISMVVQNFMKQGTPSHTKEAENDAKYVNNISKFDLTFFITELGEDISINIQYYTAIFKPETIQRLLAHLTQLIKTISQNPAIRLHDIEMITDSEKQRILYQFNHTSSVYPKHKTIPALFAEQATRTPDFIALIGSTAPGVQLSYAALNKRASQLAHYLKNRGVVPDTIVGIQCERSIDMIVGVLGILQAGGAYMPIALDYPPERIAYMIGDSGLTILLTAHELSPLFMPTVPPSTNTPPVIDNYASALAYVIYTSGSTGKPKGVMVEHSNVVRLVKNTHFIDFLPDDRIVQTGALEFDASTFEIWGVLLNGLTLCLKSKEDLLNPEKLKSSIIYNKITMLWLTAQLFNQFVQVDVTIFAPLRCVLVGGDVLSPPHINQLRNSYPRLRIINGYGPTENTTFSTTYVIEHEYHEKIPIGTPITNSTAYIIDPIGNLQPIGIVGELWVGGEGVSRGYMNNPELTAATFLYSSPWSKKIYKTGDLARWLTDGDIEFLGRRDQQVKIRGFRIELGEIENQLVRHPNIKEAVVLVHENEQSDKYVCAYIVSAPDQDNPDKANVAESELRNFMAKHLPDYMIPAYFVSLEKIPLTANGKINRCALPHPQFKSTLSYEAPRNALETKLVAIWSDVLHIESGVIGINSHFFHLGGHSLNATMLVSKIHRQLGIKVPLAELFKNPSITGLSTYITGHMTTGKRFLAIAPAETREYYPLSSAQKRLFFLFQFDSASTSYNMPMVIHLGKATDAQQLDSILKKLIARHDNFRTSFIRVHDETFQRVHPQVSFASEVFVLAQSNLDQTNNAPRMETVIRDFVRPFDLSRAPLFRSSLLRTPADDYIWLLDMHHIISDGTSQTILTQDFFALSEGRELPPLRLQYKDFSQWQNRLLADGSIKMQEEYWLRQLAGEIPRLDLPVDYKRPAMFTFTGSRYSFMVESEDAVLFRALGDTHGATLFMNILAVLNVLFFKYTGQTDIIIGSPIAGRYHDDLQHIVGMFVNTLVLRNAPLGEKTYQAFLKEVCGTCINAFENQDVQFEQLVEKLDLERDPSRNPLFDISMVVQNFVKADQGIPVPEHDQKHENDVAKFDLTFFIIESGENLLINTQYYAGIFAQETIQRLISHFVLLIKKVTQNPAILLKDIDIISESEKQRILYEFNNNHGHYPVSKTIHGLFEEQVARTPDGIAIFEANSPGVQHSYAQLNEMATRFAHYLVSQGGKAAQCIGLLADRSVEMIVAILAIWKIGGAYIPLNPKAPAARSLFMLKDSASGLLLVTPRLAQTSDTVKNWAGQTIIIGDLGVTRGELPLVVASRYAYIIFTSGSTGNPKGVPITHANVCPLLHWGVQHLPFDSHDRVLQNLSYYFDWSVWEIWITLITGAILVIVADDMVLDPAVCVPFMKENRITALHVTPTQYQHWIASGERLESLKYLFLGAEKLTVDLLTRSFASVSDFCRVFNMYGPTETTIIASVLEIPRGPNNPFEALSSVPIGSPVANNIMHVLDHYFNLCPINITGQLYITGQGLAAGYLNNPELTAATFLSQSISSIPSTSSISSTLYKTGDLARWLPNGSLEFLGRIDQQVKIRGFRIELGEIESQLLGHPDIKEAFVLARQEVSGDRYLCAYLVSSKECQDSQLREWLAQDLPDYMIPSYFVFLEQIPLTPNGKIDQKALPHPQFKSETSYVAPRNELEIKLCAIWAAVLNLEKDLVSIDSNFFQLGGHSLKATILVSKIHQCFDVKVPLVEIFRTPRIRELADYIKGKSKEFFIAIEPAEEREYYLLSPAQKRLYILQHLVTDNISYNMPQMIPLIGDIKKEALTAIFYRLIARHESLRTSFITVNDEPVQVVHQNVDFSIALYERSAETDPVIPIAHFVKPFDLSQAPLLRVILITVGGANSAIFIDMHHIITDGTSQGVLEKDFWTFVSGVDLPPLPLQYKDYSQWYQQTSQQAAIKQQEIYWLSEYSSDIPVLHLPTDYPRPRVQQAEGNAVSFFLPPADTAHIKSMAEKNNVSLYMVLLAVFNVLLAKLCGQEDIIIGTPIAARRHADLHHVIGMFVNTLAMRNYPAASKPFNQFLHDVRHRTLQAFDNQEYPFEVLVERIQVNRDTSRNPVFDVMFNLLNQADYQDDTFESIHGDSYSHRRRTAKFDITLKAIEISAGISFILEYSTHLFRPQSIDKIIRYFKNSLSIFAADDSVKIFALQMMGQAEINEILSFVNGQQTQPDSQLTLPQLFAAQVARTPDRIALIGAPSQAVQLSYAALNQQSEQLASGLQAKGILPDTIVAILVDRSIETIIAILAILKAGGAYCPIDPDYPQERIDFILQDSQATILLTPITPVTHVTPIIPIIPRIPITPTNLAYIIYTSGSTGRPKGVQIEHAAVVNLLNYQKEFFNMQVSDRVLQFSTLCFDASVEQVFLTLTTGATLVLIDKDTLLVQDQFTQHVARQSINHLHAVPFFLEQLNPQHFYHIKRVLSGGDACPKALAQKWYKRCSFYNKYGPTETTVASVEGLIREIADSFPHLPIGKPMGNTQIYLLDRAMMIVPLGVTGEIYIGGAGVARGYLNHPELTHDQFLTHSKLAPILYKTGDLARWLPDGTIQFLGRRDYQVKIRGFRIELGEIENQLLTHAAIKEAVVVARAESNGDKYLCAYIVSDLAWDGSQLQEYLAKELPAHMIPAYFVPLEKMPLTSSGKIARHALPLPQIKSDAGYVAPTTPMEAELVTLWAEVLAIGAEVIGIHSNFFQLGGHSLKATIVLSKMNKKYNVQVPLVELFKTPTINALAAYIQNMDAVAQKTLIPNDESLVKLKVGTGTTNLFLIHDGTGEVEGYLEFCTVLESPFFCWGLRASFLQNGVPQKVTIEDIAAHYIHIIQQVQPAGSGPYFIAGWSLGGTIAYEVARQLENRGENISFLGLIDSPGPQKEWVQQAPRFTLAADIAWILEYLPDPHLAKKINHVSSLTQLWEIVLAHLEKNNDHVEALKQIIPPHVAQAIPNFERLQIRELIYAFNINRTLSQARTLYMPAEKIQTTMHYFNASLSPSILKEGWQEYCAAPILYQEIPGDHFSIFKKPHVEHTARILATTLAEFK